MSECLSLGASADSIIQPLDVVESVSEMDAVVSGVLAKMSRLDVLVLNAGATTPAADEEPRAGQPQGARGPARARLARCAPRASSPHPSGHR